MRVTVITSDNYEILSFMTNKKTIKGVRSEIKRMSIALHDSWKIRLEFTVIE
jgi:hypothetical protein